MGCADQHRRPVRQQALLTLASTSMRLWLIVLLTLTTKTVFAQVMIRLNGDTTIPIKLLDSLQAVTFLQKEKNNQMYWTYELKLRVKKVDTLSARPDSVVVNHSTPDGRVVKQQVLHYDNKSCLSWSEEKFFNEKGLLAYRETFRHWCGPMKEDEVFIERIRTHFERREYGPQGRIVKWVYWYSISRIMRITYTYDASGKQSKHWEKIQVHEFWN